MEKFKTLLPYFLLAVAIIAAYRISGEMGIFFDFLRRAWGVVAPFFYGFLLAYIFNIPCGSIQKLLVKTKNKFIIKRRNVISLLIVLLLFVLLIVLVLNIVIPAIANSIAFFIANLPVYWDGVLRLINEFNNLELFGLHINAEAILGQLSGAFENFSIDTLWAPINAIMGAATAVFSGAIAFISSIYILIEKENCKAYLNKLLKVFASDRVRVTTIDIFSKLNKNFRQYIHTQTIDGMILGTMATVALFIMRSPFALVLGLMLGIVNYIPYFGSIFGTLVAVLVVTFTQGLTMGLIAAVALFVIQQIDANIIQPKLMSGSFALSPLLVIISITIGGAFAGIFGMIIAIPIIAVLKDLLDDVVAYVAHKKSGVSDELEGQVELDFQEADQE